MILILNTESYYASCSMLKFKDGLNLRMTVHSFLGCDSLWYENRAKPCYLVTVLLLRSYKTLPSLWQIPVPMYCLSHSYAYF